MKYSEIALKFLALKEMKLLGTTSYFFKNFSNLEDFMSFSNKVENDLDYLEKLKELKNTLTNKQSMDGFLCIFDEEFPSLNINVKNSEKPTLLFYKGDINLLNNIENNIAVIGHTKPDDEILRRGVKLLESIDLNSKCIVSGLALGCDSLGHKIALKNSAKTIAILPSTLDKISPASNKSLADEIVKSNGLLLTEYFSEATNRNDVIKRYIDRDRLQAMFSSVIILLASYRKGEGDSGSIHAMNYAKKIGIKRYAMFSSNTDTFNIQFGLNKDLIENESVEVVMKSSMDDINKKASNVKLESSIKNSFYQQKLF